MGQKGENYNIWLEGFERLTYQSFVGNLETENIVVGGGITGVLTTYLLAKAGRGVVLLEKGRLGEWTTDCTTGFLTQSLDTSYYDLIKIFGKDEAGLIAESHGQAIDLIEKIIIEEKIDCDFKRTNNYLVARKDWEIDQIEKEVEAMSILGLSAEIKKDKNISLPNLAYLELSNQATFHPLKFITALAKKAEDLGAKIFEQSEVIEIKGEKNNWKIVTKNGELKSQEIVVATHEPFHQPWSLYFKKAMYHSYVYELSFPQNYLRDGLYEDLHRPYHYFKVDNFSDRCRIIFGGEDHREDIKINREKCYKALELQAREIFPDGEFKINRFWSGQIQESVDGLAYIGRDKKTDLFYAFGFSGNGLTYSVVAAHLILEIITNQDNLMRKYEKIYRVNRWPNWRALLVKGRDYVSIFLGGALKHLLK